LSIFLPFGSSSWSAASYLSAYLELKIKIEEIVIDEVKSVFLKIKIVAGFDRQAG